MTNLLVWHENKVLSFATQFFLEFAHSMQELATSILASCPPSIATNLKHKINQVAHSTTPVYGGYNFHTFYRRKVLEAVFSAAVNIITTSLNLFEVVFFVVMN